MTWLWVACATVAGFSIGLLLGAGEGWTAIAVAVAAGVLTYAVRRPRRMAWLGWLLFDGAPDDDESGWDRMRQREIVRRRRASAIARDAAEAGASPDPARPTALAGRRRSRFPRWRRKHPPDRSDSSGFFG